MECGADGMTDLSEEETITLRRVLINRYVRQLAVDVRIAPESGRLRDTRSTSQKCQIQTHAPQQTAPVAVGTRVSSRAPRTEPYVRLSRIRLQPRVCDGKAFARPRMKDDRFRKPVVRQLRHPRPCDPILLAAPPQRTPPEVDDMVPEHGQCPGIGRHCVVVEVAVDDIPQPLSLNGDRLVHAPPHLLFDHPQLRPHAVSPGLPFDLEFALASLAADEGEAQEVEGLRLAEPAPLAAFRRKASELNEPCLLGMQCQRKLQ